MKKNFVDPMIADANGNVYISVREYKEDMEKVKDKIQEYRKSLMFAKKAMERLARKSDTDIESIKALGYAECLKHIIKDLKEMMGIKDGDN